jgi:hypothetical protein
MFPFDPSDLYLGIDTLSEGKDIDRKNATVAYTKNKETVPIPR